MTLPTLLSFLPGPGSVCALPSWDNPRLLFPAESLSERWQRSAFYPAFKTRGRLYRMALRAKVALVPQARKIQDDGEWPFRDFLADTLPTAVSATVLVGTPGPAQKITIQFRDKTGKILGYGKFAEKANARIRVRKEWEILNALPPGVAPRAVQLGEVGDGEMLVVEPVDGEAVRPELPPDSQIVQFAESLLRSDSHRIDEHPWVIEARGQAAGLDLLLEPLKVRDWPTAIRHGDFAPWNLRRRGGEVVAFDWEYGSLNGFPFLDLAFMYLQTAALINGLDPQSAFDGAVAFLLDGPLAEIGKVGCESIVRMAVLESYLLAKDDGHSDAAELQEWRLSLLGGVL